MHNILATVSLFLCCYFLLVLFRPRGHVATILLSFCLLTAEIVLGGYLLSAINRLSDLGYWSLYGVITASLCFALAVVNGRLGQLVLPRRRLLPKVSVSWFTAQVRSWSWYERTTLLAMFAAAAACGLANLAVALFTAPTHWDGMTCYLARVAYYLQHGSLAHYDANFYAQIATPKNHAVLALYTLLVSGRNENACQLIQYLSYWVATCAVYGITASLGCSRKEALFASLVFALLPQCLLQAVTTQQDLLVAAYSGSLSYFLLVFRRTHQWRYLAFSGLAAGLSVGTKVTALLALLAMTPVFLYCLVGTCQPARGRLRALLVFAASVSLGIAVFGLPSGYLENYRVFGNPIGPPEVRQLLGVSERSYSSYGSSAWEGVKNAARIGFGFLSLDGLPPVSPVSGVQVLVRLIPRTAAEKIGMNLPFSIGGHPNRWFNYNRPPTIHEDMSYWGILGFGLIWIAVAMSVAGVMGYWRFRPFSFASLLFFVGVSFGVRYGTDVSRYFPPCAVCAVPVVGLCLRARSGFLRAYVAIVVLIGCASALSAVTVRPDRPLVALHYQGSVWESVFRRDRISQLMAHNRRYAPAMRRYEELVPKCATVAVWLAARSYEYPLFGATLTRRIIPLNVYGKGTQPIPTDADYLLYGEGYPRGLADDVHLGADWYLRELRK